MIILIWFAFAILTGLAAKKRNRNAGGWFLIGLVFGIFGLIAVLVVGENTTLKG